MISPLILINYSKYFYEDQTLTYMYVKVRLWSRVEDLRTNLELYMRDWHLKKRRSLNACLKCTIK